MCNVSPRFGLDIKIKTVKRYLVPREKGLICSERNINFLWVKTLFEGKVAVHRPSSCRVLLHN